MEKPVVAPQGPGVGDLELIFFVGVKKKEKNWFDRAFEWIFSNMVL